ncbi:Fc.00g036470.m01.CDS01 [Cosmosporella sp. VM-42]
MESGSPSHRRGLRRVSATQGLRDVSCALRKSVSHGDMLDMMPESDEDSDDGHGIKFSTSPHIYRVTLPVKSSSDNGTGFQLGSFAENDVFSFGTHTKEEPKDKAPLTPVAEENLTKAVTETSEVLDTRSDVLPDPQYIWPNQYCVFLANLPRSYDNAALEVAIKRAFGRYGVVFVKVKRDKRDMPLAFLQYTNEEDARRAAEEGRGLMILGRSCRTEMCNGSVSYIIYKQSGEVVLPEEAERVFRPYGRIAKIEEASMDLCTRLELPQALIVAYTMYDAKRDVIKAIGRQTPFTVRPFDPKIATDDRTASENRTYDQYDRDRRSAYFGGLPPYVDQNFVRRLATRFCRNVEDIQLRETKTQSGDAIRFAFVLFEEHEAVNEVVEYYRGHVISGRFPLRVEQKRTKEPETPRRYLSCGPTNSNKSFTASGRTPAGPSRDRYLHQTPAPSSVASVYNGSYSQRASGSVIGRPPSEYYTPMEKGATTHFPEYGSGQPAHSAQRGLIRQGSMYSTPSLAEGSPHFQDQRQAQVGSQRQVSVQSPGHYPSQVPLQTHSPLLVGPSCAPVQSPVRCNPSQVTVQGPLQGQSHGSPDVRSYNPAHLLAAATPYGGQHRAPSGVQTVPQVSAAAPVPGGTFRDVPASHNVGKAQAQTSSGNAAKRAADRAAERLGMLPYTQEEQTTKVTVAAPVAKAITPEADKQVAPEVTTQVAKYSKAPEVSEAQALIQPHNPPPQYPPYGYCMPPYVQQPVTPQVTPGMQQPYGCELPGYMIKYNGYGQPVGFQADTPMHPQMPQMGPPHPAYPPQMMHPQVMAGTMPMSSLPSVPQTAIAAPKEPKVTEFGEEGSEDPRR